MQSFLVEQVSFLHRKILTNNALLDHSCLQRLDRSYSFYFLEQINQLAGTSNIDAINVADWLKNHCTFIKNSRFTPFARPMGLETTCLLRLAQYCSKALEYTPHELLLPGFHSEISTPDGQISLSDIPLKEVFSRCIISPDDPSKIISIRWLSSMKLPMPLPLHPKGKPSPQTLSSNEIRALFQSSLVAINLEKIYQIAHRQVSIGALLSHELGLLSERLHLVDKASQALINFAQQYQTFFILFDSEIPGPLKEFLDKLMDKYLPYANADTHNNRRIWSDMYAHLSLDALLKKPDIKEALLNMPGEISAKKKMSLSKIFSDLCSIISKNHIDNAQALGINIELLEALKTSLSFQHTHELCLLHNLEPEQTRHIIAFACNDQQHDSTLLHYMTKDELILLLRKSSPAQIKAFLEIWDVKQQMLLLKDSESFFEILSFFADQHEKYQILAHSLNRVFPAILLSSTISNKDFPFSLPKLLEKLPNPWHRKIINQEIIKYFDSLHNISEYQEYMLHNEIVPLLSNEQLRTIAHAQFHKLETHFLCLEKSQIKRILDALFGEEQPNDLSWVKDIPSVKKCFDLCLKSLRHRNLLTKTLSRSNTDTLVALLNQGDPNNLEQDLGYILYSLGLKAIDCHRVIAAIVTIPDLIKKIRRHHKVSSIVEMIDKFPFKDTAFTQELLFQCLDDIPPETHYSPDFLSVILKKGDAELKEQLAQSIMIVLPFFCRTSDEFFSVINIFLTAKLNKPAQDIIRLLMADNGELLKILIEQTPHQEQLNQMMQWYALLQISFSQQLEPMMQHVFLPSLKGATQHNDAPIERLLRLGELDFSRALTLLCASSATQPLSQSKELQLIALSLHKIPDNHDLRQIVNNLSPEKRQSIYEHLARAPFNTEMRSFLHIKDVIAYINGCQPLKKSHHWFGIRAEERLITAYQNILSLCPSIIESWEWFTFIPQKYQSLWFNWLISHYLEEINFTLFFNPQHFALLPKILKLRKIVDLSNLILELQHKLPALIILLVSLGLTPRRMSSIKKDLPPELSNCIDQLLITQLGPILTTGAEHLSWEWVSWAFKQHTPTVYQTILFMPLKKELRERFEALTLPQISELIPMSNRALAVACLSRIIAPEKLLSSIASLSGQDYAYFWQLISRDFIPPYQQYLFNVTYLSIDLEFLHYLINKNFFFIPESHYQSVIAINAPRLASSNVPFEIIKNFFPTKSRVLHALSIDILREKVISTLLDSDCQWLRTLGRTPEEITQITDYFNEEQKIFSQRSFNITQQEIDGLLFFAGDELNHLELEQHISGELSKKRPFQLLHFTSSPFEFELAQPAVGHCSSSSLTLEQTTVAATSSDSSEQIRSNESGLLLSDTSNSRPSSCPTVTTATGNEQVADLLPVNDSDLSEPFKKNKKSRHP